MTKGTPFTPDQPISALTIGDLETLVAEVVRRILRQEMSRAVGLPSNGEGLPKALLATFGSWEDVRSAESIVTEIYEGRTVSVNEVDL